jgi:hypothetical protein
MGAGTLMMTVTPVVTTAVTTMCSHRFISNKPCGLGTQRSRRRLHRDRGLAVFRLKLVHGR